MIILFGSSGYIGSEFKKQLINRGVTYYCWENSSQTSLKDLRKFSKEIPGKHTVINAAGYTGKPNVDACEIDKANCIVGNVLFPSILSEWCIENDFILAHVSSGCIYSGEKILMRVSTRAIRPTSVLKKIIAVFTAAQKL